MATKKKIPFHLKLRNKKEPVCTCTNTTNLEHKNHSDITNSSEEENNFEGFEDSEINVSSPSSSIDNTTSESSPERSNSNSEEEIELAEQGVTNKEDGTEENPELSNLLPGEENIESSTPEEGRTVIEEEQTSTHNIEQNTILNHTSVDTNQQINTKIYQIWKIT